jgi:hypothetical protein
VRYFDETGASVLDSSSYGYKTGSEVKRSILDVFSATHCSMTEAKQYSYRKTKMRCGWCGIPMFSESDGVKKIVEGLVAHDHIYPSARYGILCKGNVLVCCATCNGEKSDKEPVEYFEERLLRKVPTLFASTKEFENFLEDFTRPYKEDWPEYYKLALEGDLTRTDTQILGHYFMIDQTTGEDLIDLSVKPRSLRQTNDPNNIIWNQMDKLESPIYRKYSFYSAKDVKDRVSYTQAFYLNRHPKKLITKLTKTEFLDFGNELILSKVTSNREIEKIRRLLNVLVNMPEMSKFKILEKHFYKFKEAQRESARREALNTEQVNNSVELGRLNFAGEEHIDGLKFSTDN